MTLVEVGRIGRAHGLKGETYLDGCSLSADELLEMRDFTWRSARGLTQTLTLVAVRPANDRLLVGFAGFTSREQVSALTNGELLAEADRIPDPGPGVAYAFQVVGFELRDAAGKPLGTVQDVLNLAAHQVYVVLGEREYMVPVTPEIVRKVDMEARTITVDLPAGLDQI
jgi:16S rRNA processing protein RimM